VALEHDGGSAGAGLIFGLNVVNTTQKYTVIFFVFLDYLTNEGAYK
jgi:hypothetical protein